MINNKKLDPIVTDLFIRGRKLKILIVFITQSYFEVPKDVRLNSSHLFIMKIPNKRELQKITSNQSSDIDFKDFIKIHRKFPAEPYSSLVNDITLLSNNLLRFRKNLLNKYIIKSWQLTNRLRIKNYNKILKEKLRKISALPSGEIDKHGYLTDE